MSLKDNAKKLLEEVLEAHSSLFLIDYKVYPGNRIEVIIDGDEGVTVAHCMAVSRAIEHNLDREEEDFSLEVMSSGVSESLQHIRQYKKNVGRKLKVKTEDAVIEGELTVASEDAVTLVWKTREPKPIGKGKVTVTKEAQVSYGDIVEAKVMITF